MRDACKLSIGGNPLTNDYMKIKDPTADELLALSNHLQRSKGVYPWLTEKYWWLMFLTTRAIEELGYPKKLDIQGEAILNFGCGIHFTRGLNSDLFSLHCYLQRRRRPDIYLSGMSAPASLHNRFDAIILEHVLEHMLPVHAHAVLCNLLEMLRTNGAIQISVPSLSRFINNSQNNRIRMDILAINNITYNFGHKFMYDERALGALLAAAGYRDIQVNCYETSPWKEFLVPQREPESIYIIAKKL